jgi:hypothetical protein
MLGFEPIVDGGWAFILFCLMVIGIYVTLLFTTPK